jgi:hypothetical protein
VTKADQIFGSILIAITAALVGSGITYHVIQASGGHAAAASTPKVLADPIAATAQTYGRNLLKVYAAAWRDGARKLDGGSSLEAAINQVSTSWTTGRTAIYATAITPILAKAVPEGTPDADQTAPQKQAAAAAFRSIADGLIE